MLSHGWDAGACTLTCRVCGPRWMSQAQLNATACRLMQHQPAEGNKRPILTCSLRMGSTAEVAACRTSGAASCTGTVEQTGMWFQGNSPMDGPARTFH